MKEIVPASGIADLIIGKQEVDTTAKYRIFKYSKVISAAETTIIVNLITGRIISVDNSEFVYNNLNSLQYDPNMKEAVESWFFVPVDHDDVLLCEQFEKALDAVNSIFSNRKLATYTILTTTDCNARCFYCYQLGCQHKTMTPSTANEVARFIIKNSPADRRVTLRWFGGEPLFNSEAIDIIVDELKANNISYSSTMTSNAYLFDDNMVQKAVNSWNLKSIQVTLDGTERIYNKVKNYIYKNEDNAFGRVTDNIETLLDAGVQVKIRLNMDQHNVEDLFQLGDYLLNRYSGHKNITVYAHLLYDKSCTLVEKHTDNEKLFLARKCDELNRRVSGIANNYKRPFVFKHKNHCMIDTDSSIMILPDGKLGKCEHYLDSRLIGSIYDGITDIDEYNNLKTMSHVCEKCEDCEYRFVCRSVANCPQRITSCDDSYKQNVSKNIERWALEKANLSKKGEAVDR